ncbi:MAG: hypothetical protein RJB26_378 [Pseudomonadota bacterium]|jgi:hypothetical protein
MSFTADRRHLLQQLAACGVIAALPSAIAAPLPTAALRDDVDILRRALALHPGLYRYGSPAEVAGWFTRFEAEFVAAQDETARFLLLAKLLARIRCGHTYASLFNQRKPVAERLFARPTRLPFEFRWIDDTMVVTRPYPGVVGLAPGTRIERLNGVPATAFLRELMTYARADGHNDAKRRALLSQQGEDSVEYFDVFQSLLLPSTGGVHRLQVLTPAGRHLMLELPAITLEERQAQSLRPANDGSPFWQWEMRADGIAVLTMPGWAMYSLKWKAWEPWLKERLDSLGGARALLIDLRANEGGEDVGDILLARLASRDLEFPAYDERVRFRRTPAELDPYLDTWDDSFRQLGDGGAELPGAFFQRPGSRERQTIAAVKPRLGLPVAALIGPTNSSATFQFAMQAQATGLVKLIGQTTGGNRRGINGGCFFFVRLPACGLEFDLPLVGYFPRSSQPDAGVTPDIVVPERWEDVVAGRDATMEAALSWARRA